MLDWPTSTTLKLETINVKDLVWALDLSSETIEAELLEGNLDGESFISVQVACPWSMRSFVIYSALLKTPTVTGVFLSWSSMFVQE